MKNHILKLLKMIVGTAIYSFSVSALYSPANMISGGVTGISQLVNFSFGIPTSLMIILLNIPLLILAFFVVDREFTVYTVFGTFLSALFIHLFAGISLNFDSALTSVVLGGVLNGLGMGIVFRSGTSTGGFDIISKIIQKKFSGNMAYTGLFLNIAVIGASAMIHGLDKAVLTLCAMYIATQVNTIIIDGIDHRRALSIVTGNPNAVSAALFKATGHGATILTAEGSFSHKNESMLYCVISKRQLENAKRAIRDTDPQAFFTITIVTGVYGHGHDFKSVLKDIK